MMTLGDIIQTPDGPGKVIAIEDYSRLQTKRVCVDLDDKTKYDFDPCYFLNEVTALSEVNKQLSLL